MYEEEKIIKRIRRNKRRKRRSRRRKKEEEIGGKNDGDSKVLRESLTRGKLKLRERVGGRMKRRKKSEQDHKGSQ